MLQMVAVVVNVLAIVLGFWLVLVVQKHKGVQSIQC